MRREAKHICDCKWNLNQTVDSMTMYGPKKEALCINFCGKRHHFKSNCEWCRESATAGAIIVALRGKLQQRKCLE